MAKGGACVDGQLTTTLYSSPIPLIGLYIAVGTMICFFCMSFDLVYGLIRRKPFLPCKLFRMNSFTITVVAIATKIPLDLTTSMPRAEDQLSKLTSTALMCTCIGFYIPSLGTMGSSERYGNMAALSVMVITMVVNVCIQMHTGVIFAFRVEHIIVIVCILLLLLLMWSSAITFGGQIEELKGQIGVFKVEEARLKEDLVKIHVTNYTGNGQTLFCETSHHHAFGIISGLCFSVVLQAMLRLFALKNMRLYCNGASDYKWSIPIVIVIQFLTIALGTFSILYRWLSYLCHTDGVHVLNIMELLERPELGKSSTFSIVCRWLSCLCHDGDFDFGPINSSLVELEKLSWGVLTSVGLFYNMLPALKVTILIATVVTQILLYYFTGLFFGVPSYIVKKFLVHIIPFHRIFHESSTGREVEKMLTEMSSINRGVETFTLSFQPDHGFKRWIGESAIKDVMRDHPTHLIQLLSKWQQRASASSSTAAIFPPETGGSSLFVNQLEALGKDFFKFLMEDKRRNIWEYEYRVSCMSVLVLSAIIKELMPSSSDSKESLMKSLSESFEAIYFVDQNCIHMGSEIDRIRSMAGKEVWAQRDNPNHWFQHIISFAFQKKSEESESHNLDYRRILRDAISNTGQILRDAISNNVHCIHPREYRVYPQNLISAEFSVLSKFILEKLTEFKREDDDLIVEECLARMLSCMLSRLPEAIIKEIGESNPLELEQRRLNKALKFFCKLELLGDTIEWSLPQKEDNRQSRANVAHSNSNSNSVSNVVDDNVVSNSALVEENEDAGGIIEIQGSDENV